MMMVMMVVVVASHKQCQGHCMDLGTLLSLYKEWGCGVAKMR